VRNHVSNIYVKLGVPDRARAIVHARRPACRNGVGTRPVFWPIRGHITRDIDKHDRHTRISQASRPPVRGCPDDD
jgi:hypothetical protein